MINEKNLIDWCWNNLRFDNCPENWEDTYIIDILNGYQGTCHDCNGNIFTYANIRAKFTDDEEKTRDNYTCACGNTADDLGFYPCDKNGEEIEPNDDSNWANLYVCAKCKNIINFDEI